MWDRELIWIEFWLRLRMVICVWDGMEWECVSNWFWNWFVRNKINDNLVYVHMHKHTHKILPVESLSSDMMPKYWVIIEIIWLTTTPRCWVASVWMAWQMRSTWVGRQVSQCHGIRLLFVNDQHVESSFALMPYYSMMRIVEKQTDNIWFIELRLMLLKLLVAMDMLESEIY